MAFALVNVFPAKTAKSSVKNRLFDKYWTCTGVFSCRLTPKKNRVAQLNVVRPGVHL